MSGTAAQRGFIYQTAVFPQFRMKGLARKLVDEAIAALEREGINKAALVVFAGNEIGNAFWEHIGFTVREDLNYRNKNIHDLKRIDT